MSNTRKLAQSDHGAPRHHQRRGRRRQPSRSVGDLVAVPGHAGARFLAAGALGSAALMAALPAGTVATATSTATAGSQAVSLTADVQPVPASGTQGSSVLQFLNQAAGGIQNFAGQVAGGAQNVAGQVGTALSNSMGYYGAAEMYNAQLNQAMARGVVAALPNAWDQAVNWGDKGIPIGVGIGTTVGAVGGGIFGSAGGPPGTVAGAVGGAKAGGEIGFYAGTTIGTLGGFIDGLVTSPTWQNITWPTPPPDLVPGAVQQDTASQQGSAAGSPPQGIQPPAAQPPAPAPPTTQPSSPQSPGDPAQPAPGGPAQPPPGQQGQADTGTTVAQAGDPASAVNDGAPTATPADGSAGSVQTAGPDQSSGSYQVAGPDQPDSGASMVSVADATGPVTG